MSDFIRRILHRSAVSKSRTRRISRKLDIEHLEVRSVPSITGTVFQDSNINGTNDSEPGVAFVSVTAYDPDGQIGATASTDSSGNYTLNTVANIYRVEFTNLPTGSVSTVFGSNSGTTIQFVQDGGQASLGLFNPTNTTLPPTSLPTTPTTNPNLVTSSYVYGDNVNGSNRDESVIIDFPFSSGAAASSTNPDDLSNPTTHSLNVAANQVGTTFGLGYNSVTQAIYAASFTKRHAGYGPNGASGLPTGVVYQMGTSGSSAIPFVDLNALGFGTVAPNFRTGYQFESEYDRDSGNAGWDAVGKSSLGGLDVSANGTRVYVINLADRQLYALGVDTTTNTFDGTAYRVSIPDAVNVSGATRAANDPDMRGDLRPFAVQVFNGKIYVGVVNSAESTQNPNDMRAYVFEVSDSGTGLSFNSTPVLNTSLNYARGQIEEASANWLPWVSSFATITNNETGSYPQAMLSSLAFDATGNVVLGFRDRSGDQFGFSTRDNPNDDTQYYGTTAGDILRATANTSGNPSAGLTLESNGTLTSLNMNVGAIVNNQGPGGGEFYYQDDLPGFSDEIALGGVAQVNGSNEIASTIYLPGRALGTDAFVSAGIGFYDNSTGENTRAYRAFRDFKADFKFATANGLGDLLAVPGPVSQIGNRVWADTNADGIQDADERSSPGVTVLLFNSANQQVGSTVTSNIGQYYFDDSNVAGGLVNGETYQVRIDRRQDILFGENNLTAINADGSPNGDLRDSDAVTVGDFAVITFTVGVPSAVNHNLDFGFVPQGGPAPYSIGNRVWNDTNADGLLNNGESGIDAVIVRLYTDTNNDNVPDAAIRTTTTQNNGYYRFDNLVEGNYIVEVDTTTGGLGNFTSTTPDVANPNTDIDNDENGVNVGANFVRSQTVTVSGFDEPTNESDIGPGDPGTINERSNLSVDFGFVPQIVIPPVYSIGNRVWSDDNADGLLNNGEAGIDGVTVRLYADADGNGTPDAGPIGTTTTTNGGYYRFDNLALGGYIVEVDTQTGGLQNFTSTSPDVGNPNTDIDNDDNGVFLGAVLGGASFARSGTVTVGPGGSEPTNESDIGPTDPGAPNERSNLSVDFGFVPQGGPPAYSIGNRVWLDGNRDGLLNNNEPGIDGVTVRLYADADQNGVPDGGALATTTTANNGYYRFDDLDAGNYVVEVDTTTGSLPLLQSTTPDVANPNTDIDNDENGSNVGIGFVRSGTVTIGPGSTEPVNETDLGPGDPGAPNERSNLSVDFGFVALGVEPTYSLGNRVWLDTNRDGLLNNNELGIDGVTVRLSADANGDGVPDGLAIATTTTANGGYYRFDGLAAGKYIVQVVTTSAPLIGLVSTTPNVANPNTDIDNDDNVAFATLVGGGEGTVGSGTVILGPGDTEPTNETDFGPGDGVTQNNRSNLTIDFGFVAPPNPPVFSLGNRVWLDTNRDGLLNNNELGINGVTVRLYADANADGSPDGAALATMVTANNGYYRFDGLAAGKYLVEIDANSTPLTGLVSTTPNVANPNTDIDNDDNAASAAAVLGGISVIRSGTVILGPGDTEPTNETDFGPGDGVTQNNRSNLTIDFGFVAPPNPPLYSLGNRVWNDSNKDGIRTNDEPGINGMTIRLYADANGDNIPDGAPIATTVTANGGYYRFDGLLAGNYIVEAVSGNRISTTDGGDPDNNIDNDDNGTIIGVGTVRSSAVTLGPGDVEPTNESDIGPGDPGAPNERSNLSVDFGFVPVVIDTPVYSLGNRVWRDDNKDGFINGTEPGIDGITVRLYRDSDGNGTPDGVAIATTTTANNGYYRFDELTEGTYIVEVVTTGVLANFTSTIDAGDPDANPTDSDDNGVIIGTGIVRSLPVTLGPLGSEPINEADLGPGDPGAPNAFSNLTVDFGFVAPPPVIPPVYSLGNRVWNDLNKDGIRTNDEPGIDGITVRLFADANGDSIPDGGAIALTTTANGGYYRFDNLAAGSYVVDAITGNFTSTIDGGTTDVDNDDNGTFIGAGFVRSSTVTLGPGDSEPTNETDFGPGDTVAANNRSNLTIDFGFIPPTVPPPLLSLGNLVWFDNNNNGVFDPGVERGAENIPVRLVQNGIVIRSTTTDLNGFYLFTELTAGDYVVEITPPTGFSSSTGRGGINGSPAGPRLTEPGVDPNTDIDNDDNGTNQGVGRIISSAVTLTANGEPITEDGNPNSNLTVDFGILQFPQLATDISLISGYVYRDTTTIDGKREPALGETGIGGTTVRLTGISDDGRTITRQMLTNTEGFYEFTNLPAGRYTVTEVQPRGNWIDGIDTPGTLGSALGGNDIITVALPANSASRENNFGEVLPFAPFGYVYLDLEKNGTRDSGDPGVPNVPVTIQGTVFAGTPFERPLVASDVPGGVTILTNSDGYYIFPSVPPGVYTITAVNPPGFTDGIEENTDPNAPFTIQVGTNIFSNVTPSDQNLRGQLNFSLQVPVVPGQPTDITKRQFLASTGLGATSPRALPIPPVGRANALGDQSAVPLEPSFTRRTGDVTKPTFVATGTETGLAPTVRVFDFSNGLELYRFNAYEASFTGGVRVATGDVDGDGIEDIVTVPGEGGGPLVRVFSGNTGREIGNFFAFSGQFFGGLNIAVGDLNNDGKAELIVGAGVGGGPRVQVFDFQGNELFNFFAYDSSFRGGVRVASGDLDGDGFDDIITGGGVGGGQHVKAYNGRNGAEILNFMADDGTSRGGAWVTAGDIDKDGKAEIIVAGGQGSSPIVRAFNGGAGLVTSFAAYESGVQGGVRLAATDIDGDGDDDIVTAPGNGGSASIKIFDALSSQVLDAFWNTDTSYLGGAYVG